MGYDGPTERAGGVGGAVFGQGAQARLAEDVVAGVAHVRAEVHIQTHSADVTLTVPGV